MTLLERLKIETRPAHDRIERTVDLEGRITSRTAYRALLGRFYGFHVAWEPRAEAALGHPDFFRGRRKTDLLAKDLQALGMDADEMAELPVCDPLMPMPDPAAAFGAMYVVEGSTLGGSVIARHAERRLGLSPTSGCSYFRSYGPEVGPMWRSFGAMLLGVSSAETDETIVASANRTFEVMRIWLSEEPRV